jgi:hypothetical protein
MIYDKYFNFLVKDFKLKKSTYRVSRDLFTEYENEKVKFTIIYDGTETMYVSNHKKSFKLDSLDSKKQIWNSVSSDNFPDKKLWWYYKIIERNPELIDGNMKKFSFWERLKRKLNI